MVSALRTRGLLAARPFARAFSRTVRSGSSGYEVSGASVLSMSKSTPRSRSIFARLGLPLARVRRIVSCLMVVQLYHRGVRLVNRNQLGKIYRAGTSAGTVPTLSPHFSAESLRPHRSQVVLNEVLVLALAVCDNVQALLAQYLSVQNVVLAFLAQRQLVVASISTYIKVIFLIHYAGA